MANYYALKAAIQAVIKTNGAHEITGANMQTALLSIIDSLGTGYQFMGVATPATEPPSSPDYNIAYIAGAGSYTNFGTAVVIPPTNIAIFKYNGSWACEQVTVENGGVFDITAYNNNTTYADLAAALGTNGANVPVSVRKGGMSVKFVQTSDNKYLQFRLMSDSFNTTETNWQGVDDKPKASSKNLVESDGVFQEDIRQNIELYDNIKLNLTPVNIIQDAYINNKGVIRRGTGNGNIYVYELPVNGIFRYNHATGSGAASICLFSDSSCSSLISVLFVGSELGTSFYKNETGSVVYLGFSSLYGGNVVEKYHIESSLKSENIKNIINEKSFDIDTFKTLFQYEEIKQSSTKLASSYINNTGAIVSSDSSWNIFIFTVSEGEKYHISGSTGGATFSVAFYSNSTIAYENLISIVPKDSATFDTIVSAPKGAAVLAITNNYEFDYNHLVYLLKPIGSFINIDQIQENQINQELVCAACETNEKNISGTTIDGYYIDVTTGNPTSASGYHYKLYQISPGKIYHIKGYTGSSAAYIGIGTYKSDTISSTNFIRNIHSGDASYDLYFRALENENYLAVTDLYLLASNFAKEVEVVPNDSNRLVMCWGDSLTYSGGSKLTYNYGYYPNKLQELLPKYEVINAGEGGDTCQTLLSRQQGFVVSTDFILNADRTQKSLVTFDYGTPLRQFQVIDMVNPCYIDGIECTITASGDDYYIQRTTNGNSNRSIPAGTFITSNGLRNYNHPKVLIAFIGTNNGFTSAETWRDMIIDTYEKIRIVSSCERMVVISTHKGVWDGDNVNNLKVVEDGLLEKYGARFINWRLYASTNAIYDAGLTPTQADLDAMAAGWCPPQLMVDDVHLTQTGYEVLATYIYNRLVELGDVI